MYAPIHANYTARGDDWTVEVKVGDTTRTATARDLVAARERADQLVEDMLAGDRKRTVVHTLDGDAVNFTAAYLTARLGLGDDPAAPAHTIPAQAASEPVRPSALA
ncbi:hypothetical protein [Actinokineospora inagensis]|uniref:hypothetical protein n=1 Tax=Actinokineospora inagensis TaxID=103730 RepID=UPI000425043C|nr:hypothetical protein [Actinokineospora inagensis]